MSLEKKEKIGIGIITCNRQEYLQNLLTSISSCTFEELVIVNDGDNLKKITLNIPHTQIKNKTNLGVGRSKNKAMQYLLDRDCDYIFIIEDDTIILDSLIFERYIQASKKTGIQHFNFGPGTPFNRKQIISNFDLHNRHLLDNNSQPNPKITIDYSNNIKIDLYEHVAGIFSFFTKEILQKVGLHDDRFFNAWEHVDHTLRIINEKGHPPFWWFADIHDSIKYLSIPTDSIDRSTTSNNKEEWLKNINAGREIYRNKHGFYPNMCKHTSKEDMINTLKEIKELWK